MMSRYRTTLVLVLALAGQPVLGETLVERITGQLKDQGYSRVTVSRTLLGRTRIVATAPKVEREIVVNTRTGEILRDLEEVEDGHSRMEIRKSEAVSASGRNRGADSDDDGDGEDDGTSHSDGHQGRGGGHGEGEGDGDGDGDGGDGDGDGDGDGGDGDGDGDGGED